MAIGRLWRPGGGWLGSVDSWPLARTSTKHREILAWRRFTAIPGTSLLLGPVSPALEPPGPSGVVDRRPGECRGENWKAAMRYGPCPDR